jgi:hypothetical protein
MTDSSQGSPGKKLEKQSGNYLLAEDKTKADFEATANSTSARGIIIRKHSSRLVSLFGFMFFGMAIYDEVMHRHHAMACTLFFIGLSVFAVAWCLHNIEKRLASIEQAQKFNETGDGESHRESVKQVLLGPDDVKDGRFSSKSILEIGKENL